MRSNTAITFELDDIDLATDQLIRDIIQDFELSKNTVGILFSYSDMDTRELAKTLHRKLNFDVLGCTCIATMKERSGFHALAVTLIVLTADDCQFSVDATLDISIDNVFSETEAAYNRAVAKLTDNPKLVICFPSHISGLILDSYTNTFNKIAPHVPVIGGFPSYKEAGDEALVHCNGEVWNNRMVMLSISGNINPVFTVQNMSASDESRKRSITKSEKNIIYEVNNQRFTDYLAELGLPLDKMMDENNTIASTTNPLLLEYTLNGQVCKFSRALHAIDLENGTGTSPCEIPVGAKVSICHPEKSEIIRNAHDGMAEINNRIQASRDSGYTYSTLLAISCIGRYLILLPESNAEINEILLTLPKNISIGGFYSYGELGPSGINNKQNFVHNDSLVLCAF